MGEERPVIMMTIKRVANGWIICPNGSMKLDNYTLVAKNPIQLAEYVEKWATDEVHVVPPGEKA